YCKLIVHVLQELGMDVVTWGNDDHLQQVATHVMGRSGIPDCVGMLDGPLVRLTEMPECNGFSFICQKKYPAINIQAIIDHKMWFTGIKLGWPRSVSDVTMWKKSYIW
ncbi:hypothetical protein BD769DRAFT_1311346, partial [Suillus cothurnatus]